MNKKRTPYAECTKTGKMYVDLQYIMHPFCAFCDGLAITTFGKSKRMYLEIQDAINWCEKEKAFHSTEKYEGIVANLRRVLKEAAEEKVAYQ